MNWVGGARNRIRLKQDKKQQSDYFEKKRFTSKIQRFKDHGSPSSRLKAVSLDLLSLQTVSSSHGLNSRRGKSSPMNVIKINLDKAKPLHKRYEDIELPMSPCKIPSKLQLSDIPERSQNTCRHENQPNTEPSGTTLFSAAANKPSYTSAKQSSQLSYLPIKPHNFIQTLKVPATEAVTEGSIIQQCQNIDLQFHQGKENSEPQDLKKPALTADPPYMPYSQPAPRNVFTSAFEWRKRQCDSSADSAAYSYDNAGPPGKKATLEQNLGKISTHIGHLKREQCSDWESSPGSRSSYCSSDSDSESDNNTSIPELVQCKYNDKDNVKKTYRYQENSCVFLKNKAPIAQDVQNATSGSQVTAVTSQNVRPHNLNLEALSTASTTDHLSVLYCSETLSDMTDSHMSTQPATKLDRRSYSNKVIRRSSHKASIKSDNSQNNLRNMPIQCKSLWMNTVNTNNDTTDELADATMSSTSDTKSPQHKKWMDFINQPVVHQYDTIGCCRAELLHCGSSGQVRSNRTDNPTNTNIETCGEDITKTIPNESKHNTLGFYKTGNTQPQSISEHVPKGSELEKNMLVKSTTRYLIQHKLEDIESSLKDRNVEAIPPCEETEMKVAEEAMKEVMTLDMQMNDIFDEEDMLSQLSNISQLAGGCNISVMQNGKDLQSMINPPIEMLSFSSDDQGKAPIWKAHSSMKGADTIPNTTPSKSQANSSSTAHFGIQSDTNNISKQPPKDNGTQEITEFDQKSVNTDVINSELEKNKSKETNKKDDISSQLSGASKTSGASELTIEGGRNNNTTERNATSIETNNDARKGTPNIVETKMTNNDCPSLDSSGKTSGMTNVKVDDSSSLTKSKETFVDLACTPDKQCEQSLKTNTSCKLEVNTEGSSRVVTEVRDISATDTRNDSCNNEVYQQIGNKNLADACQNITTNCHLLTIPLQQSKGEQTDIIPVTIHEVQTEMTEVQSISVQCDESSFNVTKTQDAGIQCNVEEEPELRIKFTEHKATQTLQDDQDSHDVSSSHVDNAMKVESTENSISVEVKYNLRARKPT